MLAVYFVLGCVLTALGFSLPAFPEMQTVQQPTYLPLNPPYPTQTVQPNSLAYTSYAFPAPAPQVPVSSFQTPQTVNIPSNPHAAGQTLPKSDYGPNPQMHTHTQQKDRVNYSIS